MDKALEQQVRRRARERCEYCQMPQRFYRQRFPIDHIVARQHGGPSHEANLALCCPACNRHKGPNLSGIDPETGLLTRLFHPRTDRWSEHFVWDGPRLVGISPIGRTSIVVLAVNDLEYLGVRSSLIAEGVFPPSE